MSKKLIAVALAAVLFAAGLSYGRDSSSKRRRPKPSSSPRSAGAASIKGVMGVYMKHVESGETVGLNENRRFQLASVFKIPVLVTLFKQIHQGRSPSMTGSISSRR